MLLVSTTIESFTHLLQGVLLLGFALLLRHYFVAYQRQYLRYWSFASGVFGASEVLRFAVLAFPDVVSLWFIQGLMAVALGTQYLALMFLAVGVLDITRGQIPFVAARRLFYFGAFFTGLFSVTAFIYSPALAANIDSLGLSIKFSVTGLMLLGLGGLIIRAAASSLGPRMIALSFALIGLKNLTLAYLVIAPFATPSLDVMLALKGLANLTLLTIAATGVVIWLLESERSNTILAMQRAEYLNTHDALTGVENREQLVNKIPVFIDYCRGNGRHLSVLLVGINRFKAINDMLGIRGGDRVLTELASRLESFTPQPLAVARISGDVFAIVFDHLKRRSFLIDMAELLLARVQRPMQIDGREISMNCAIGIARYPQHGSRAELLINKATIALANAKLIENDSVVFYERGMDEPYTRLVDLEPDLRRALREDEFLLYLQPFEDAQRGELCGFEALIRWQHPTRGLIGPGEFLPFIEQLGMASELDEWVLEHTARMLIAWRAAGQHLVPISVNLSAKHFQQPELIHKLQQLLSKHRLDARWLALEITENVAMSDIKTGMNVIAQLQAMGLSIAIDDFGTGYSSLSYLRRLPIDSIKIDRSFIAELQTTDADATIVKTLIDLAHGLGKQVVAEGVERAYQHQLLVELGCDVIQGYYYSPPVTEQLALELLPKPQQQPVAHSRLARQS